MPSLRPSHGTHWGPVWTRTRLRKRGGATSSPACRRQRHARPRDHRDRPRDEYDRRDRCPGGLLLREPRTGPVPLERQGADLDPAGHGRRPVHARRGDRQLRGTTPPGHDGLDGVVLRRARGLPDQSRHRHRGGPTLAGLDAAVRGRGRLGARAQGVHLRRSETGRRTRPLAIRSPRERRSSPAARAALALKAGGGSGPPTVAANAQAANIVDSVAYPVTPAPRRTRRTSPCPSRVPPSSSVRRHCP